MHVKWPVPYVTTPNLTCTVLTSISNDFQLPMSLFNVTPVGDSESHNLVVSHHFAIFFDFMPFLGSVVLVR
jgi:hypothetical protein